MASAPCFPHGGHSIRVTLSKPLAAATSLWPGPTLSSRTARLAYTASMSTSYPPGPTPHLSRSIISLLLCLAEGKHIGTDIRNPSLFPFPFHSTVGDQGLRSAQCLFFTLSHHLYLPYWEAPGAAPTIHPPAPTPRPFSCEILFPKPS